MRLFLLPISTRRTLIYCERVQQVLAPGEKAPITERVINRASETWAKWERAEKGWQKQLTVQGNRLLRRIPYEEWGLKSIPPFTKKRLEDLESGALKFECLYPGAFLKESKVLQTLRALATERQAFHRKTMWTCIFWSPFTIPFALVPMQVTQTPHLHIHGYVKQANVIPNIPFFYLVFRAYSHYKALYGGRLLEHLTTNNLIKVIDSPQMDEMYAAGLLHPTRQASREASRPTNADTEKIAGVIETQTKGDKEDVMVLQKWNGKLIAEAFRLPEMEVEIERAVEQVEKALEKQKDELEEEKMEIMRALAQKTELKAEVKGTDVR